MAAYISKLSTHLKQTFSALWPHYWSVLIFLGGGVWFEYLRIHIHFIENIYFKYFKGVWEHDWNNWEYIFILLKIFVVNISLVLIKEISIQFRIHFPQECIYPSLQIKRYYEIFIQLQKKDEKIRIV